ncbi:unnamed protein product [Chrysodeixis includens]|uniref:Uncharacterized protein n=1 Tax=Chrysodeixis includens TaxID=689277 RepID=A0A9N8KW95_CHRIL|nr:unnamed protein product [Chrysodeixis includens]
MTRCNDSVNTNADDVEEYLILAVASDFARANIGYSCKNPTRSNAVGYKECHCVNPGCQLIPVAPDNRKRRSTPGVLAAAPVAYAAPIAKVAYAAPVAKVSYAPAAVSYAHAPVAYAAPVAKVAYAAPVAHVSYASPAISYHH